MTEETLPLIPKLLKRWSWSKRFTKEEKEELKQIEKGAYMERAREYAKEKGISKSKEDFEGDLS